MIFKRSRKFEVFSPVDGMYVRQENINDSTYSSKIMGIGCGIYPDSNVISSPIDGEVIMVFPTGHAVGIKRKDGLEILIHIGIDTVNLKGKGFTTLVKQGGKVKVGDELVRFDKEKILNNDLDPTVVMIFTNSMSFHISMSDKSDKITTRDVISYVK